MDILHGTLKVYIAGSVTDLTALQAADDVSTRVRWPTINLQKTRGNQFGRLTFDLILTELDTPPTVGDVMVLVEENVTSDITVSTAVSTTDAVSPSLHWKLTLSASPGPQNSLVGYTMVFEDTAGSPYSHFGRIFYHDGTDMRVNASPVALVGGHDDFQTGTWPIHYFHFGGVVIDVEEQPPSLGQVETGTAYAETTMRVTVADWSHEMNSVLTNVVGEANPITVTVLCRPDLLGHFWLTALGADDNIQVDFTAEAKAEIVKRLMSRLGLQHFISPDRCIVVYHSSTYGAPLSIVETGAERGDHGRVAVKGNRVNLFNGMYGWSSTANEFIFGRDYESLDTYGQRDSKLVDTGSDRDTVAQEMGALLTVFRQPMQSVKTLTTSPAAGRLEPGMSIQTRVNRLGQDINRPMFIDRTQTRCLGYSDALGRYIWSTQVQVQSVFGDIPTPDEVLKSMITKADEADSDSSDVVKSRVQGGAEQCQLQVTGSVTFA